MCVSPEMKIAIPTCFSGLIANCLQVCCSGRHADRRLVRTSDGTHSLHLLFFYPHTDIVDLDHMTQTNQPEYAGKDDEEVGNVTIVYEDDT